MVVMLGILHGLRKSIEISTGQSGELRGELNAVKAQNKILIDKASELEKLMIAKKKMTDSIEPE